MSAIRPTPLANRVVALFIIEKVLKIDGHRCIFWNSDGGKRRLSVIATGHLGELFPAVRNAH